MTTKKTNKEQKPKDYQLLLLEELKKLNKNIERIADSIEVIDEELVSLNDNEYSNLGKLAGRDY